MNTLVLETGELMTKKEIDRLRRLIQPYCDEYGLSQSELAVRLGVKQSTISAFVIGRLHRPGEWLNAFAEMVEGWEPEPAPAELKFDESTLTILSALSAAHKAGDKDILARIAKAQSDLEDVQERAKRVHRDIEAIVQFIQERKGKP